METSSRLYTEETEWNEVIESQISAEARSDVAKQSIEQSVANSEMELTVDTFRKHVGALEEAMRLNPHSEFNGNWLNPDGEGDGAVYARILDSLGKEGQKQLDPYQVTALKYMRFQVGLNNVQALVDFGNRDKAGSIRELISEAIAKKEQVSDAEKHKFDSLINTMSSTYSRMVPGSGVRKATGEELSTFVELAEKNADTESLKDAAEALQFATWCTKQDYETYVVLAGKHPRNAVEVQQRQSAAVEPEALRQSQENLDVRRAKLAELYAKRQKRVWLADPMDEFYGLGKRAMHFQSVRRHYDAAAQTQIAQEIMSREFDSMKSIDEYIALRTVQFSNELTNDITENYGKNNRVLGKVINFLAGRNEKGERETSTKAKWGKRALTYGVSGGLAVLTAATGGSLAAVGAAGAWGGAKIFSIWEAKRRHERMQRTEGLLGADAVRARIKSTVDIKQDPNDPSGEKFVELNPVELVEAKIGRAVWAVVDAAEKDTTEQQRKRAGRLLGSAAAGATVAVGGHYLGAWLHGGDQHVAASGPQAPKAPGGHQSWFGNMQPPTHSAIPEINTPSNIFAHPNEGWYEVMQQLGIDPARRHDVLLRAAPAMYKYHLAYQMPDGLPGIPKAGNIPQIAIDMLKYAANK